MSDGPELEDLSAEQLVALARRLRAGLPADLVPCADRTARSALMALGLVRSRLLALGRSYSHEEWKALVEGAE